MSSYKQPKTDMPGVHNPTTQNMIEINQRVFKLEHKKLIFVYSRP